MGHVKVGISGWTYAGWRGTFYPPRLGHKHELEFAGRELPTIEVNGTLYSLPRPASFRRWYDLTPPGLVLAVRANRYVTHVRRLKDVSTPVANFFANGVLALGEKLGPILWQFPPNLGFGPDRWEAFLALLPRDFRETRRRAAGHPLAPDRTFLGAPVNHRIRHAVEVRHVSFLNQWFVDLLRAHNVVLVFADTAGKWPYFEDVTADFVYLRPLGDAELYVSGYGARALDFWCERISRGERGGEPADRLTITEAAAPPQPRDVYVYFDNDAKVRAPVDAKNPLRRLRNLH
jgi:uncharacterized protein YecE (DUF72 family)